MALVPTVCNLCLVLMQTLRKGDRSDWSAYQRYDRGLIVPRNSGFSIVAPEEKGGELRE